MTTSIPTTFGKKNSTTKDKNIITMQKQSSQNGHAQTYLSLLVSLLHHIQMNQSGLFESRRGVVQKMPGMITKF